MRYSRLLFAIVFLVASTVAAHADTFTYTYTGHDFAGVIAPYTTSDFVSGSFTLAAPITANQDLFTDIVQPLSFSFTDGVQTITNLTATSSSFGIGTDSTGAINAWRIVMQILAGQDDNAITTALIPISIMTSDSGSNSGVFGDNHGDPGTWTETLNPSAVPEPSTLALLGTGILGLAGVARRKLS